MDPLEQFKKTFFEECNDLLATAESQLLAIADGDGSASGEELNAIFRAVHSIKGGAGAFGFERLVRFAHTFESLLAAMRSGTVRLEKDGDALALLQGFDVLADLVGAAREGSDLPAGHESQIARTLELWLARGSRAAAEQDAPALRAGPQAPEPEPKRERVSAPAAPPAGWQIRFEPKGDLLRKANEPLLLIRELKSLGPMTVSLDESRLPPIEGLDPEDAYYAWTLTLNAPVPLARVKEVFEFVEDDCRLDLRPIDGNGSVAAAADATTDAAENHGVQAPAPPAAAASAAGASAPVAVAPATQPPANTGTAATAAPGAGGEGGGSGGQVTSIRVDLERVDRLVNMVGEIVITQAMLTLEAARLQGDKHSELLQRLAEMAQHTRELQESVMAIRAQPVKSVFSRMPRLVRELAAQLGKDVRLVTVGENTEVDKTVIEQLSDPLTHMIRNAVDHGIEMPDVREAAGKPRTGTIVLLAEHRSGRIVIEIVDDGAGINRARVKAKCIEKGLIPPDASPSDEEIDNFIFMPGFSTADRVSNISGRGVGMDVVKRNIQGLGGRISIASTPGQGSRFTMALPLTLAVLDGMIVTVGRERYVVPLTSIVECMRPKRQEMSNLVNAGEVLSVRGEYVRLCHIARVFNIPDAVTDPSKGLVVVVDVEQGGKLGLVVDELIGQQQVVIKGLESNYQRIEGVSAATILGDGRVALIIDVAAISHLRDHQPARAQPLMLAAV